MNHTCVWPLPSPPLCLIKSLFAHLKQVLLSFQVMVRQEVYRKQGYAVQADEEQLRVQLEALQAELNAPMQFKVTGCVT